MLLRLIPALLLFALAGCATTGQGTDVATQVVPDSPEVAVTVPSSTATIDEHLFVPPVQPAAEDATELHVHDSVWERLVHNFELPECSTHEDSVTWAKWYAARPEYMGRIFKRAQPWIYHITDEIEKRDLPGVRRWCL